MRKIYVYENHEVLNLEPIVLTRPAFELRCGAFTFLERIQKSFPDAEIELIVRDELKALTQEMHPDLTVNPEQVEEGLWILGNVLWQTDDIKKISKKDYQFYYNNGVLIAAYLRKDIGNNWLKMGGPLKDKMLVCPTISEINSKVIKYLWNTVNLIGAALNDDKKYFQPIDLKNESLSGIHLINEDNIYIKSPELIKPGAVLDASDGPLIISKNVKIDSHSLLRGPLFIGENSTVQPHTFIRDSVIGPSCKIGGEISSSILQSWSNKVHYGFLGNSYIGQWVNFGAGTTNSNLKNNYTTVKMTVNGNTVKTDEMFIGLFAGDYTTFAIGTMLNTGTNIGPGCNIVTNGFPPRRINPFTWLLNGRKMKTNETKFFDFAETMQNRRGKSLSLAEKDLLAKILIK
ncbi:MAG: putative sugar nucleotidyl transferase [Candidatus Neomarinimicrobiota bacterium]